jgi:hypothetical protein
MHYTTLGPGDEATWPAYTGHPLDPRNSANDNNSLDEWEADEMAAEQLASTAANVLDWLQSVCNDDASGEPVETNSIHDAQLQDAPAAVLLACIMTGSDRQAGFARMFLRERFEAARATEITERSAELIEQANIHRDYCDEE